MFDRYYCIKANCDAWKFEIFEENEPVNIYFLRLKARGNGTVTACVLKTPLPGQIPTSCWRHAFTFATVYATDADVTFYDGPGMHTVKAAKQVYNSTWIALLKHGFVLVKTWLLIACGTGFYAIITCNGPLKILAWRQQRQASAGRGYKQWFPIHFVFLRLRRHLAINYHRLFSYWFKCLDAIHVLLKMTNVVVTSE